MTIPERLKAARAALGFTQKQMAEQSGVSARGYQGYEDGRSLPGAEAMAGLVRLGINANWLLKGDGPMLLADLEDGPIPDFVRKDQQGREESKPQGSAMPAFRVAESVDSLLLQQVADFFFAWMDENRNRVRIDRSRWGAVIAVLYKVAAKSGKAEKAELEQVLSIAA